MAGVGALDGGVVFGEQRVELGAVEPGQHLAGLDHVAVLGVELDDRQAVDARGDLRLFARDERPETIQPVDEFARRGGRDGDGGGRRRGCSASAAAACAGQSAAPTGRPSAPRLLRRRRAGLEFAVAPPRRPPAPRDDQERQERVIAGHSSAGSHGPPRTKHS